MPKPNDDEWTDVPTGQPGSADEWTDVSHDLASEPTAPMAAEATGKVAAEEADRPALRKMTDAIGVEKKSDEPIYDTVSQYLAHPIAKAAGYPGGLARTIFASAYSPLLGKQAVSWKDVLDSLKGNAPSSSEYMGRLGLPELGRVSDMFPDAKGKSLDVSGRDILGTIADAAQDPLMYDLPLEGLGKLPGMEKITQALEKAKDFRPVGDTIYEAGKKPYRNAMRPVSKNLIKSKHNIGEFEFPDLMYNDKVFKSGMSPTELVSALEDYKENTLGPQYDLLRKTPAMEKQRIRISQVLGDTVPFLKDAATRGLERDQAFSLAAKINRDARLGNKYFPGGRTPDQMMDLAKNYSDLAKGKIGGPGDIMQEGSRVTPLKSGAMTFSNDIRNYVNELAEKYGADPEAIKALNRKYTVTSDAEKPMLQMASREMGKYPFTQVDAGLTAADMARSAATGKLDPLTTAMIAGKRAARYFNSPSGGVRMGNTLRSLSEKRIFDNVWKQALINQGLDRGENQ